jgi:hypothetical protein
MMFLHFVCHYYVSMIQLPPPCFSLNRMDHVKINFLFWLLGTATSFAFRLLEPETTQKWNILYLPNHWPTECSVCSQCQGWACPHHICVTASHRLLLKRITCGCHQGHNPPTLLLAMLRAHPTTPLHRPLYIPVPPCTRNPLPHRPLTTWILKYYCQPRINPHLLHISGGITRETLTCMTG